MGAMTIFSCGFYDIRTLAAALEIIQRDHIPAGEIALISFTPGEAAEVSLLRQGERYELVVTTGKSTIGEHMRAKRNDSTYA